MTSTAVSDLREGLLNIARETIISGLGGVRPAAPEDTEIMPPLRHRQASFVTLTNREGGLRGCCGSLEPRSSLAADLASNAWRTAFDDPRFEPVTSDELAALNLEIALLSPLESLKVDSLAELHSELVANHHGLLLQGSTGRGTFLPKVWDNLPDPQDFVSQLMRKAGLPGWTSDLQAWTYTTECYSGPVVE